ncbi:hypothetical protein IU405_08885 [Polaribacter sp. BAL334]|uniref:hypothetical protein n=1 Tax=Polaribacter sp. BAL334 TaxID=1708178 RepID=UPI0018D248FA|nr:hypothetical protein [Polaribacter sp. BAL334]MBG7612361.1 hypothetical protein [Polaribacter sp. BAL334]
MYTQKNINELIELSKNQKSLTFESQLKLQVEFKKRNLQTNISELENSINKKLLEIKNLEYLKNLGLEFVNIGNYIRIQRTTKAILIDFIAIILGILFCIIGFYGIVGIISYFLSDNEFDILSLIIQVGLISIGILGIKFLNGIKRLIDYAGFELLNENGIITLKKRFDTKLIKIQKNESLLELKEQSELITLKLENIEIISANVNNIVQRMTIEELTKRLKTVANTVQN